MVLNGYVSVQDPVYQFSCSVLRPVSRASYVAAVDVIVGIRDVIPSILSRA